METYSLELSQELEKLPDVVLTILVLECRPDGRPPHALALAGFFMRSAWHIFSHKRHYDVIHFGDMVQIGLAWWSRLCSPSTCNVIALHGLDVIYGRRSGVLPRIYRAYLSWAQRRNCVDCFIANSRNTGSLLQQQGFDPVSVVPLATRVVSDGQNVPVEEIGDEQFVLFFGRIFARKGPRWFAENVLPLLDDEILFYVVGTIWDEQDGTYLRNHPRVRMPGAFPADISLDEFYSLKRRAIAIVMPNQNNPDGTDVEGFGLTALEAADNGAPLIASDLEGIRDAVMHGKTGFLEPAEDARAWAARIDELRQWSIEQRKEFSNEAVRCLRQHYSWERVATDTASVYRRCLETKGSNLERQS